MTEELRFNLDLISDRKILLRAFQNPLIIPAFIEMIEESEQLPNAMKELSYLKEALIKFQKKSTIENFLKIWEIIEKLS